jgi:hypothetical protein
MAAGLGLAGWCAVAAASPVVVADSACPHHAIDIEAFATCEGDRVAAPEPESTVDRRVALDPPPGDSVQPTELKAVEGDDVELPNAMSVARAGSGRP